MLTKQLCSVPSLALALAAPLAARIASVLWSKLRLRVTSRQQRLSVSSHGSSTSAHQKVLISPAIVAATATSVTLGA